MNTDISSNSKTMSYCNHDNVYYVYPNENESNPQSRASLPQGSIVYDEGVDNQYSNKNTGLYGETIDGIGLSSDELSDITGLNPKVSDFLINEFNRDKGINSSFIMDDDIVDFIDFLADDIGLDLDKEPKSNTAQSSSSNNQAPLNQVYDEAFDGEGLSTYEVSKLYKTNNEEEAETYMRNFLYSNGQKEQALSGKQPILTPKQVNDFHKFMKQQ